VLGFSIQAILLPQIDSLFTFSLLFAAVIAFGAWIGTSGPRIAYAGSQIVLAYDLVNLNRFTIATSLVPARDVVLGIVLGIAAMWLIFDHLWATPSTDVTRKLFLSCIREIAAFAASEGETPAATRAQYLLAECDRITAKLDRVRNLVDVSVFEANPKPQEEIYLTRYIKAVMPELRAFLLVDSGLLHHRLVITAEPLSELVIEVRERCHATLLETARVIEQNAPVEESTLAIDLHRLGPAVARAMQQAVTEGRQDRLVEMRLCASLLALANHLHASALSIGAAGLSSNDAMCPPSLGMAMPISGLLDGRQK